MATGYLDLARTFQRIDPGGSLERTALDSYTKLLMGSKSESWGSLLEHRLVVVLGEPGCGKTREFKERAKILQQQGETAYFLPLDRLVSEGISSILNAQEFETFQLWIKDPYSEATFFLDSVDEAKFKGIHEFHYSFARFTSQLGNAIGRAKILISSRISEWNPETDLGEVLSKLPPPPMFGQAPMSVEDGDKERVDYIIGVMQPLSNDQIVAFCSHLNLGNLEAFTTALTKDHGWEFARRPLDVIDLISVWKERGRLGSLTELIESTIERGLKETGERAGVDPLTPKKARSGAETLGASNTLCKEFTFSVEDDGILTISDSLSPSACLPKTWVPSEVRALMMRSLFDGASYGKIRFHHRRLTEYLAASWFSRLMDQGCKMDSLMAVLFDQRGERPILRPELEPVAAWLCGVKSPWADLLRSTVLDTSPWIFLKFGDPAALPVDYRARILKAVVDSFRDREHVLLDLDLEALSRYGDPGFEGELVKYITDKTISDDLRSDLIMIASESGLLKCISVCLEIFRDDSESESLKCTSLYLIRKIGNKIALDSLRMIMESKPAFTSQICSYLCQALFPYPLSAAGLVSLLRKSEEVPEHSVGLPYFLRTHIQDKLSDVNVEDLFLELLTLWRSEPHVTFGGADVILSSKYIWIGDIIVLPMINLLKNENLPESIIDQLALAVLMVHDYKTYVPSLKDIPESYEEAVTRNTRVRQKCYWLLVDAAKRQRKRTQLNWWAEVLGAHDELRPEIWDLNWMVRDARHRIEKSDREMILRHAVQLCFIKGHRKTWLPRFLSLVGWRMDGIKEVSRYILEDVRRFFFLLWQSHVTHRKLRHHWYNRLFDKFRTGYLKIKEYLWLHSHTRSIQSGRLVGTVHFLINKSSTHKMSDYHLSETPWLEMGQRYGPRIARSAKAGAKAIFWSFDPTLPIDRIGSQSLPYQYGIGLTGAQALVDDGEVDFATLSSDVTTRFTKFALNEMNGFPTWLSPLAVAQPAAVREVLLKEIRGEWTLKGDDAIWTQVLYQLVWRGEFLKKVIVDDLLDLLDTISPENVSALHSTISIILDFPYLYARLETVLVKILSSYQPGSPAWVAILATLLQINPGIGVPILEGRLSTETEPEALITKIASALSGDSQGGVKVVGDSPIFHAKALRSLIPTLFKYIRVQDDLHHENQGVFSPGDRDHAQRFRDGLLQRLAHSTDPGAITALQELADEPALALRKDWLLHLQHVNRRQTATLTPWTPFDVRAFESQGELVPRTDEELFQVAIRRLIDIKKETEYGDQSRREDLDSEDPETRLRRWFHSELSRRANDQYSASQEEEIAGKDHPDIRLHLTTCHPLPVELKWAENWSLNDLVERLKNQLIGQYLRDDKSRFGVFLLGYIGKGGQRHWKDSAGNLYDFEALVTYLQGRANEFVRQDDAIYGVRVIGVRFIPR